jgi:hypothetical protein
MMGNLDLITYATILSIACLIASVWINDQGSAA